MSATQEATTNRTIVVSFPEQPYFGVGELPGTVVIQPLPIDESAWPDLSEVELMVTGPWVSRDWAERAMRQMDALRIVQTVSAGVDWIRPAVPEHVRICSAAGITDPAVAEWCVAALLALTRDFPKFAALQHEHRWERPLSDVSEMPRELGGSTVLILGYGSIGKAVEARLMPFGVEVIRVARTARGDIHGVDELEALLPQADAIVLTLPLTSATDRIVDDGFLSRLRPGAMLVNAGRGGLVDTDALLRALVARTIHAALDVVTPDPLPSDHPLWAAPQLLVTPHVAGLTAVGLTARATAFVTDQIRRYAAGEPLRNVVEGEY